MTTFHITLNIDQIHNYQTIQVKVLPSSSSTSISPSASSVSDSEPEILDKSPKIKLR